MSPRVSRIWILLVLLLVSASAWAERCKNTVAGIRSVQGVVEYRAASSRTWLPVTLKTRLCNGDSVNVRARGRVVLIFADHTLLKLGANSTLTITGIKTSQPSVLDLIRGVGHFISRNPGNLTIKTPYVNAAIEGTEFVVDVRKAMVDVVVYEGKVRAFNSLGKVLVGPGFTARTKPGQAPVRFRTIRPRNAVHWSLYYPPVYYPVAADKSGAPSNVLRSYRYLGKGDYDNALKAIERNRTGRDIDGIYHASLLMYFGRTDAAEKILNGIGGNNRVQGEKLALKAIIAVTENRAAEADTLIRRARALAPKSTTVLIASSYVLQSQFKLKEARAALQSAVAVDNGNPLAWARLAELELSLADYDKALASAQKAISLQPGNSRANTMLGFSWLARMNTARAIQSFNKAMLLDTADPLPRLGLGLALIRRGELADGRRHIEIAVSLDPNNALLRSYLGKAYYEEKRNRLAASQLQMAKALDPNDPTPWYYDAIRKQSSNRPVEAMHDLQTAIRLNRKRAVYRSRLLLDRDLASRSASLARIYNDLGYSQLALNQGYRALRQDPSSHSSHRLLADAYLSRPRHEIARVSELLQSQLLAPLNINPIQPQAAESNLGILNGSGPGNTSNYEFNPLFTQNGHYFQFNGILGSFGTRGNEMIYSGLKDNISWSLGNYIHKTDGFRQNNDQDNRLRTAFLQVAASHKTSYQFEYRDTRLFKGDRSLNFSPSNFSTSKRESTETEMARFGMKHVFSPASLMLFSLQEQKRYVTLLTPGVPKTEASTKRGGRVMELQYQRKSELHKYVAGVGVSRADENKIITLTFPFPCPLPSCITKTLGVIDHDNGYVYGHYQVGTDKTVSYGLSYERVNSAVENAHQFSPKLGLVWDVSKDFTFRAAIFRTLMRDLVNDQTIEPTHVAGFNQFFFDAAATDARNYGIGVDGRLQGGMKYGAEFMYRQLKTPVLSGGTTTNYFNWHERLGRGYLYWAPRKDLSTRLEYLFEGFNRPQLTSSAGIVDLKTHTLTFGAAWHASSGLSVKADANYISQDGQFFFNSTPSVGKDSFWIVNASLQYRFPNRRGLVELGVKNLLNRNFRYHEIDPRNPRYYPERFGYLKLVLPMKF